VYFTTASPADFDVAVVVSASASVLSLSVAVSSSDSDEEDEEEEDDDAGFSSFPDDFEEDEDDDDFDEAIGDTLTVPAGAVPAMFMNPTVLENPPRICTATNPTTAKTANVVMAAYRLVFTASAAGCFRLLLLLLDAPSSARSTSNNGCRSFAILIRTVPLVWAAARPLFISS
jgi:hypothetical protein